MSVTSLNPAAIATFGGVRASDHERPTGARPENGRVRPLAATPTQENVMTARLFAAAAATLVLATIADTALADGAHHEALVLAASNTTTNALMVFDSSGTLLRQIP